MQVSTQKIMPCLWFDAQAQEAAEFYTSIFPNSKITSTSHYPAAGEDIHGKGAGTVMTVAFEIAGQPLVALNGGPQFTFDEAISLQIHCDSQEEVDYYWDKLTDGGAEGPCGWLKDKFGLSWQVTPRALLDIVTGGDRERAARAMNAMFQMKKLDIAALEKAAA